MANKYLNYITDEHLFECIENLHNSYLRAKANITKSKFYRNKIDTIKLTFDYKFNEMCNLSIFKFSQPFPQNLPIQK